MSVLSLEKISASGSGGAQTTQLTGWCTLVREGAPDLLRAHIGETHLSSGSGVTIFLTSLMLCHKHTSTISSMTAEADDFDAIRGSQILLPDRKYTCCEPRYEGAQNIAITKPICQMNSLSIF